MSPGRVVLSARFNTDARSSPCSGVAHLAAHDGNPAGEEAGPPCHLPAPAGRWPTVTVRVEIETGDRAVPVLSPGFPSDPETALAGPANRRGPRLEVARDQARFSSCGTPAEVRGLVLATCVPLAQFVA